MQVSELKEMIHFLIENSSEDTLEYMYSLPEELDYSDEFKTKLDQEYDAYQEDETGHTREEIDGIVNNLFTYK
jgi:hypothetical protein